ncbi:hypothetical protein AGMMS49942_04620 [Spirochaetia bacterium]|nr:hypothetical protein AGMMS49942_04620 [Spirochaetia bacterium]
MSEYNFFQIDEIYQVGCLLAKGQKAQFYNETTAYFFGIKGGFIISRDGDKYLIENKEYSE